MRRQAFTAPKPPPMDYEYPRINTDGSDCLRFIYTTTRELRRRQKQVSSYRIQMRMRDCKRDARTHRIYTTTREGAWMKKEEKPIVSNTDGLGGG